MSDSPRITRLVEAQGTRRVFELDDHSIIERQGGTVSWRNNNPGNMKFEYRGSADRGVRAHRSRDQALVAAQTTYAGIVALDQWGNAIFESPQAGRDAQLRVLRNRFGDRTVEQMVGGYSTADYSGSTHHAAQVATIHRTAAAMGVDLHGKTIASMAPVELAALADGIGRFEGFRVGTVAVLHGPTAIARGGDGNATPANPPGVVTPARPAQPREPGLHARPLASTSAAHPVIHGPAVRDLQAALNRLHVGDARGHRLIEDGTFGARTGEAIGRFQQARGLPASAQADAHTRSILLAEDARLPGSPAHPGHRAYVQVLDRVHAAEVARGVRPGVHSEQLAAALLVQMQRDGVARADRVEFNNDGSRARVVQVSAQRDEPGLNRATIAVDTSEGARQALRASGEQFTAVTAHAPAPDPVHLRPPMQAFAR